MINALIRSAAALCVAFILSGDRGAIAGECLASSALGTSDLLSGIDADRRLDFIEHHMKASARRTRIWAWSWAAIYSGIVTEEMAQYSIRDHADRIDGWFNAGSAAIGVLSLAFMPQAVLKDQRWLERERRKLAPGAAICPVLAEAERRLVRDAKDQAFGKGPALHLGTFAFNFAVAAVLGIGFGHWQTAAIFLVAGEVVGEAQIASQPSEMISVLERYKAGDLRAGEIRRYNVTLVPGIASFHLRVDF